MRGIYRGVIVLGISRLANHRVNILAQDRTVRLKPGDRCFTYSVNYGVQNQIRKELS